MPIIFLDRVDAAPLANDDFSFEYNSWVANTIDVLNEVIIDVQDQLNGAGQRGTGITRKTSAQITALIDMNATPVLEEGVMWFDTTIKKLKVLVTEAIPGIANGVTETVTSV
jgi:hypothetical protein